MLRMGRVGLSLLALAAAACSGLPGRNPPVPSAEEALLTRRVEGLQKLLARGTAGSLVDFQQIVVVVHEDVVRDLLRAATPFEQTIAERYRVRVSTATAEFSDGFALVRLAGRAELIDQPVFAEVVVLGGLEVLGLEQSGLLRCQVKILAVEAKQANVAGLDESVRDLVESLGRDGLNTLLSVIDIPVRIENRLQIPAVDSRRVRIPAAEMPFEAKVVEVQVFGGRLWVGLATAMGGPTTGGPS
jgi:hypothetical protein